MNLDLTIDEAERLGLMAMHGVTAPQWDAHPTDDRIRLALDLAIADARATRRTTSKGSSR